MAVLADSVAVAGDPPLTKPAAAPTTTAIVYSRVGCPACKHAIELARSRGWDVREILDTGRDPAQEVGLRLLFKDRRLHFPVIWVPQDGVYILSTDEQPVLLKIHRLGLSDS